MFPAFRALVWGFLGGVLDDGVRDEEDVVSALRGLLGELGRGGSYPGK